MISSGEYKFSVAGINGRRFLWPVKIEATDKTLKLKFGYNKQMHEEVKSLENARWNPDQKIWTVDSSLRNWFAMRYLMGENVYERYDKPLIHVQPSRSLFNHQSEMLDFCYTRRHGIIAGEMGTGKTLVFIELMEQFPDYCWWYIGTKASIRAVKLELLKWKSKVQPQAMYTYDSLRRIVENWQGGNAPQGLFIDESSRIKNPTTKRSQMVKFLAKSCVEDHGEENSIIILASGSPAPKAPTDWWHQCLAKGTYVLTGHGPRTIENVLYSVCNGNEEVATNTGGFSRGYKKTHIIVTAEGYKIEGTPDHKILCELDGFQYWSEMKNITKGTKICLDNHTGCTWGGKGTFEEGHLMGYVLGDGTIGRKRETATRFSTRALFYTEGDRQLIKYYEGFLGKLSVAQNKDGYQVIESTKIDAIREKFNFRAKIITDNILCGTSSDFQAGLISGLFDSDGSVEMGRCRVQLYQTDYQILRDVQQMLIWRGIPCRIYEKVARESKIDGRKINPRRAHRLVISGKHVKTFKELIGFKIPHKAMVLDSVLGIKSQMSQEYTAEVVWSREMQEEVEVFDISVPATNRFTANGMIVHNCEVAKAGYLKESSEIKLKKRLAIIEERESAITGMKYPHLVSWLDDDNKCAKCGQLRSALVHGEDAVLMGEGNAHAFVQSVNEVAKLHQRMQGLVLVKFKKDCFSGDTEVLTFSGPKKFRDCEKVEKLYVKTDVGMQWLDCKIASHGVKPTFEMEFGDGTKCRTTLHHEWLYQEKGVISPYKKYTNELVEGKTELPLARVELEEPSEEGYAHGFVFGDGHVYKNNVEDVQEYTKVALYGNDVDLKSTLLKFGKITYLQRVGWKQYIDAVCNMPKEWKELPSNPTKSYALGFVLGLICADGCVSGTEVRLYQANITDLNHVRDLAIYAGLRVTQIRLARELSPFDGSSKPLFQFCVSTYNLKKEWIKRKDYQKKFVVRGKNSATTVKNIAWDSTKEEETFCAYVDKYHNFTLANGVITGNCLDLPEKVYTQINLEPSKSVLRAASLLSKTAKSTIDCMIRLRELSDGFQYKDIKTGNRVPCHVCNGTKQIQEFHNTKGEPYDYQRERIEYENLVAELESKGLAIQDFEKVRETLTERAAGHVMVDCPTCSATGEVDEIMREAQQVPCPKEDALIDLIEDHEDVGRLVVYAGFTGSIERICGIVKKVGWDFLRMDGKGVQCSFDLNQYPIQGVEPTEHPLACFQRVQTNGPEKLVFVGHPGSAGMGLTLTASPTIVYWSNDFNAESRIQSEDRIHRPGMDKNRGATIVDLIHLETDKLVLENLKRKRDLQAITLGEVRKNLEVQLTEAEREQLRNESDGSGE